MQVSVVAPDALTPSCRRILGSRHTGLCIWWTTIIVINFISLHDDIATLLFMNPHGVLPLVNSKLIVCLLLYSEAQVG